MLSDIPATAGTVGNAAPGNQRSEPGAHRSANLNLGETLKRVAGIGTTEALTRKKFYHTDQGDRAKVAGATV
jgi:hypothetical protein